MLRRWLERFSRNRVVKRRLPRRFGGNPVFVTPDSALSYWKRDLDGPFETLFRWAEAYVARHDVVWDLGANVGLFTFAAAHRAGTKGQVVAIEPDQFLIQLLRRSSECGTPARAPVTVIPAAASDRFGIDRLCLASRGRSANHLASVRGSTMHGGTRRREHVVTFTLDWLAELYPPPNVLKIDVEGAELKVLQGANSLLKKHRPALLCEVRTENSKAVGTLLRQHGYALFDAKDVNGGETNAAAFNTLALPHEKRPRYIRAA